MVASRRKLLHPFPRRQESKVSKEDWIANFFENVSRFPIRMQSLWSRLLAGEATAPGTYAEAARLTLSTIDKKDAALFTKFCQFVLDDWNADSLIFDVDDIYKSAGTFIFGPGLALDTISLISLESYPGYIRKVWKNAVIFSTENPCCSIRD